VRLANVLFFIYCYLELGTVTKTRSAVVMLCYVTKHVVAAVEASGKDSYDASVAFQNLFSRKVDIGHGLQAWRAAVANS